MYLMFHPLPIIISAPRVPLRDLLCCSSIHERYDPADVCSYLSPDGGCLVRYVGGGMVDG